MTATASKPLAHASALVPLDGVVALDKPSGMTSQSAVTRVKRLFGAAKAGHTGTLDPLATGLLPVCLGEATKFAQLLLDSEKTYEASIRLGVVTTTGDREGETISAAPVRVVFNQIEQVLERFVGEITQVPPMYSALKYEGKRLYELARDGTSVSRTARRVHIRCLELRELAGDILRIRVSCSKGTYIRVLAEDIGKALDCGGSLHALRRTAVGPLLVEEGIALDVLEGLPVAERMRYLLGADATVATLPRLDVDSLQARCLVHGRVIQGSPALACGLIRVYDTPSGRFLGVCVRNRDGVIVPQRLMRDRIAEE